jgi:hypothetical protein
MQQSLTIVVDPGTSHCAPACVRIAPAANSSTAKLWGLGKQACSCSGLRDCIGDQAQLLVFARHRSSGMNASGGGTGKHHTTPELLPSRRSTLLIAIWFCCLAAEVAQCTASSNFMAMAHTAHSTCHVCTHPALSASLLLHTW